MTAPFYNPQAVLIDVQEPGAEITLEAAYSGTLVTGSSGSGKTSTIARYYKEALLTSTAHLPGGCGMVSLHAKPGDAAEDAAIIRKLGRGHDLTTIAEGTPYGLNVADWIARIGGGPLPFASLLMEMVALVSPQRDASNPFWETATRTLLIHLVLLAQLARWRVSIGCLNSLLEDAPQNLPEVRSPAWRRESALWRAILDAEAWTRHDPAAQRDLAAVKAYFLGAFARLDERTRSPVVLMVQQVFSPLMIRPLRPLLCEETTCWPEQTFEGRLFQIDMNLADYSVTGKLLAGCWKRAVQMACLKRAADASKRPVLLLIDEYANYASATDSQVQTLARSAGLISVLILQQHSSLVEAIGAEAAETLTGNLSTKWFFQNTGESNIWAANLISGRYLNKTSINTGGTHHQPGDGGGAGGHAATAGANVAEQHRQFLQPVDFLTLKRGGTAYGRWCEAVLFASGKLFDGRDASGRRTGERVPFKLVSFRQEKQT